MKEESHLQSIYFIIDMQELYIVKNEKFYFFIKFPFEGKYSFIFFEKIFIKLFLFLLYNYSLVESIIL